MNDAQRSNSSTSDTWRLFIAVPLPQNVRGIVGDIEEQLKVHDAPAKWVDPALAHITLKFLGNTRPNLVPDIERELRAIATTHRASPATIGGVGAFPSTQRPRIIWLGLDGDLAPLAQLAQDVDAAMSHIGFPAEDRPFRPHITLARLRQGKRAPDDFAAALQQLTVPKVRVPLDRVQLVRSVLGESGPTYTTLGEWQLGSPVNDSVDPIELVEHG